MKPITGQEQLKAENVKLEAMARAPDPQGRA